MILVKCIKDDDLAIKGRLYGAYRKNDDYYQLVYTVASTGLIQLVNPIFIHKDNLTIESEVIAPLINVDTKTTKVKSKANPFGLRKDTFSFDCVDCRKEFMYCGGLHNV